MAENIVVGATAAKQQEKEGKDVTLKLEIPIATMDLSELQGPLLPVIFTSH